MLEDILVYWMSLSWIPKGILEKVLKISFNLNMVSFSIFLHSALDQMDVLARPKSLEGWGLKNIFLFSKSMAAKVI
jgi:hypothetical protein